MRSTARVMEELVDRAGHRHAETRVTTPMGRSRNASRSPHGLQLRAKALVLHPVGDPVGELRGELPLYDPESQIDATRHPTARYEVTVVDDSLIDDVRPESTQIALGRLVGTGSATLHQSSVGQ